MWKTKLRKDDIEQADKLIDAIDEQMFNLLNARASLALEQLRTVAYLGPQATYTHQAALKYFSSSCKFLPTKSIREVFEKVDSDVASFVIAC
ncbi:Prephenate dehydratase domain protein [Candidatus Magnetobacterium bavaricum]|uniref:Prephenate dehydratase domain protein n=1 Tax=Candidatus Magnetobacterium bavaricum TaxID=29290 RepID=A0A0F3GMM7_9BACT|nr:Prephenate dehydratase domain protein [Candidatus Magnetobacterium bavaricum]